MKSSRIKDGIIYGKSRLSRYKQEIEHFVSGSTTRCKTDLADVNKSAAEYYFHRLRAIIAYKSKQEFHEVFGGEIDENSFGGYRKSNRGSDAGGRMAVTGLLKRGSRVYTKIIQDASGADVNADHRA